MFNRKNGIQILIVRDGYRYDTVINILLQNAKRI